MKPPIAARPTVGHQLKRCTEAGRSFGEVSFCFSRFAPRYPPSLLFLSFDRPTDLRTQRDILRLLTVWISVARCHHTLVYFFFLHFLFHSTPFLSFVLRAGPEWSWECTVIQDPNERRQQNKNGSLCMARESERARTRGTGRIKKPKQNKYSVIAPVVTKGIAQSFNARDTAVAKNDESLSSSWK